MRRIVNRIYRMGRFGRRLAKYIIYKRDRGPWYSEQLREIYRKEHDIDAGYGSYGWDQDTFEGPATLGNYCSIARPVMRLNVNHYTTAVTTHPAIFNPIFHYVEKDPRPRAPITIGHDVWICSNVTILPSVRSIGNGAVIGAGSVVTKDVPPYAIVGGVPAKVIKYRFTEEQIAVIEASKWWEQKDLSGMVDALGSYDAFCEYLNKRGNKDSV